MPQFNLDRLFKLKIIAHVLLASNVTRVNLLKLAKLAIFKLPYGKRPQVEYFIPSAQTPRPLSDLPSTVFFSLDSFLG